MPPHAEDRTLTDPATKAAADRNAADNERRKITATFFNNVAVAFIAVGVLGPFAAFIYGSNAAMPPGQFAALAPFWIGSGAGLHFLARFALRRIEG